MRERAARRQPGREVPARLAGEKASKAALLGFLLIKTRKTLTKGRREW